MDWKRLGKKALFPPLWLILLLAVVSAAGLAMVFSQGWDTSPIAYFIYVLSFYSLSVVTMFFIMVFPGKYQRFKGKVYENPLGNRIMTDRDFRTRAGLYLSLGIGFAYAMLNVITWFVAHSWWFVILAVYYLIMSVLWLLLAGYIRKKKPGTDITAEWKRAKLCAYILMLVNVCLSGAVLMILYQNRGYDYPGILIYVMALYTFYSTTMAIVNIVRHRKLESPVISTAKAVSLSPALVSMLNLETAMFAQFGKDMVEADQRIFIILTGAGISITVITLSVLLIAKANKEFKRRNYGKERQ